MFAGVDRVWMMSNGMTLAPCLQGSNEAADHMDHRVNGAVIHIVESCLRCIRETQTDRPPFLPAHRPALH